MGQVEMHMEDGENSVEPHEQVRVLPVDEASFGLIRRVVGEQLALTDMSATPAEVKELLSMANTQAGVINVVKQRFSCDFEDIIPEMESRERQLSEKQAEIVTSFGRL
ncbi:hypothetical protein Y032_0086g1943 [Ancylostoma ceylanicum]|uniref:Uncharacterized protein n=1 Tax=Ancylostoma ceylanicum TaxID=53326 RepID=A0A016TPY7_9BILA|nr:hypothetical protein Y032_0086g1943 [Ancylostoma ceylanicum]